MANFTWQSTTDEVLDGIDLKGKTALVTGVSAGLGVETSRALLAREGYRGIILGIRRDEQAIRAKERIFSPRNADGSWDPRSQPPIGMQDQEVVPWGIPADAVGWAKAAPASHSGSGPVG